MAARADVAQLARASPCHGEGRGFESLHPLSSNPAACDGHHSTYRRSGRRARGRFLPRAFAADELSRRPVPDGRLMSVQLGIGDAIFHLADEFPEMGVLVAFRAGRTKNSNFFSKKTTNCHTGRPGPRSLPLDSYYDFVSYDIVVVVVVTAPGRAGQGWAVGTDLRPRLRWCRPARAQCGCAAA